MMAKENKVRIFNRLFFRLYLNYAVMLLVTAVLICLIFMKLYADTMKEKNIEDLETQANKISSLVTEYINSERYDYCSDMLNDLARTNDMDVWTIANPNSSQPMDTRIETNAYEEFVNEDLAKTKEYVTLVKSAFDDKPKNLTFYDQLSELNMIGVAVPVKVNNEVVGAVLLLSKVENIKEITSSYLSLLVFSSVIALAISFIIVIVFATELSLPISRMRATALELAAGNYHSKTGIKRNDEIGDLAKTVDILSEKLFVNDIQRKNLDQMRLDFFANVSHELRTPITVIRAYTETLVDGVVTDKEKVMQYYDRMLSECKSMERLVRDLMTLSKMQNPDFAIEREPVNLLQVFDDIIRSATAIAEKKKITIEVIKDNPICMMLGDYDRLRQMFMVILDNAIKFSDEYKTVHINLSKSDKIRISIRDEGVGIEPEVIGNIFEKFYKSNLQQNAGGTGLGLAIAKQIALKHEGNIEVSSELGVGTEFIVTFPPLKKEF